MAEMIVNKDQLLLDAIARIAVALERIAAEMQVTREQRPRAGYTKGVR